MIGAAGATLLDAALAYAELGLKIFPLDNKRPITTRGWHDATEDRQTITDWWTAHPSARIGLPMRLNGLLAIDVDVADGKSGDVTLARLENAYGTLPRSNQQRSGRGGQHFVMRDPAPAPVPSRDVHEPGDDGWTRQAKFGGACRANLDSAGCGGGVDVRASHYIVVAPSGSYRWLAFDLTKLEDVPAAWIPLLRKPAAELGAPGELNLDGEGIAAWEAPSDPAPLTAADRERLRDELRDLGPRAKGGGTTYRAVLRVYHDYGLSIADGADYLSAWNASCGKPRDGASLKTQVRNIAATGGHWHKRGHKRSDLSTLERRLVRAWPLVRVSDDSEGVAAPSEATPTTIDGVAPEATPTTIDGTAAEPAPKTTWLPQIEPVPPPAPGSSAALLAQALTDFQAALAAPVQTGEAALLFEPAAVLLQRKYPPTVWLARGLVKRGGTLLVGGTPKSGKSWMLTELAMAVATGTQAFGEFPTGAATRVAYFYAEDLGQDVQAHLSALAVGRGMTPATAVRNLYVQPRGRFLDLLRDEDCALVVASCRAIGGVGLLCIEPLRDLHSGEEDKSDAMRDVMRRLRVISELLDGCTIGVAHHLNKSGDSKQGGQRMRGSSAIHGSTDSGIYLSGLDATGDTIANAVEVEIKGARGAGRFDLTLTLVDGPDGTSERATWAVSRTEPRAGSKVVPAKASSDAELVLRAITKASKGNEYRTLNGWKDGGVANESGAALSARRVTDAVLLLESQNRIRRDERDPHTGAMNPRGALIVPSSVSGPKRAPAAPHAATAAYTNVPEA